MPQYQYGWIFFLLCSKNWSEVQFWDLSGNTYLNNKYENRFNSYKASSIHKCLPAHSLFYYKVVLLSFLLQKFFITVPPLQISTEALPCQKNGTVKTCHVTMTTTETTVLKIIEELLVSEKLYIPYLFISREQTAEWRETALEQHLCQTSMIIQLWIINIYAIISNNCYFNCVIILTIPLMLSWSCHHTTVGLKC